MSPAVLGHRTTSAYPEGVTLYAAYGTNLDPRRMGERAPYSPLAGTGWLMGWRLTFAGAEVGWDGPLATVVEDDASQVFCSLYEIHPLDEAALDTWEGMALARWSKIRVRVHTLDGDRLAWLYALEAYEGGLPSASYLSVLADAAEAGGAPSDYVAALRAHPCRALGEAL